MSSLTVAEIRPGLVAFLDYEMLDADPTVRRCRSGSDNRPRPFVCVDVSDDECTWLPLTTSHRTYRLVIARSSLHGGDRNWRESPCYLLDGAKFYVGPKAAFARASYQNMSSRHDRAWIDAGAIEDIRAEMVKQRPRRKYSEPVYPAEIEETEHTEEASDVHELGNFQSRVLIVYRELEGHERVIAGVYLLPEIPLEDEASTAEAFIEKERHRAVTKYREFEKCAWTYDIENIEELPQ